MQNLNMLYYVHRQYIAGLEIKKKKIHVSLGAPPSPGEISTYISYYLKTFNSINNKQTSTMLHRPRLNGKQ